MALSQAKLRKFAALYVHGTYPGDWAKTAEVMGLAQPPSPSDPLLRAAIVSEGGVPPQQDASSGEMVEQLAAIAQRRDDEIHWDLLPDLTQLLGDIATGTVRATAGQVSLIKELLARKYGKAGEKQEKQVMNVMVVPTIAPDNKYHAVCPRCKYEMTGGE